jgi:fructokinase
MEKKYDVVALGEFLIDFTPAGSTDSGMKLFEQNPGGAPVNMLTAVSKAGLKTAFIGKVGDDMHGNFLIETAKQAGIDTRGIVVDDTVFTTLAFVTLDENGEREFSFARKPGADTMLCYKEVDADLLRDTKVFHIGSLSLTDEPARTTTFQAVREARKYGAVISYDPNYREPLWDNRENAMERMKSILPFEDPKEAAEYLLGIGVRLVAVTLGSEGVLICSRDGSRKVSGFVSHVVDTTGAGDSFWGAFVSQLIRADKSLEEFSIDELEEFARYGNAVASLCVEKRGGLRSIPEESETFERLAVK